MGRPLSPKTQQVLTLWFNDKTLTYQQLADTVGLTRQRIEQIIRTHDPITVAYRRIARQDQANRVRQQRAAARFVECTICGVNFERTVEAPNRRTCGDECADLAARFRPLLHPKAHEDRRLRVLMAYQNSHTYAASTDERLPSMNISNERLWNYYLYYGYLPKPRTLFLQPTNRYTQRLYEKAGKERVDAWLQKIHDYYADRPENPF